MTNFQIGVIGAFLFFIIIGVVMFAGFGGGDKTIVGTVEIWGSVNKEIFSSLLKEIKSDEKAFDSVKYRQIEAEIFDQELAEALASGKGPDVFLLTQDSILKHQEKILTIPYDSYSLRDFKDKFIEEGELYLTPQGVLGLPFIVDPMVMYWNRTIFSEAGIAKPPSNWDQLFSMTEDLTQRDADLNILTSAISFGEFRNVDHAKDIISSLIIQAGNPIVSRDNEGDAKVSLSQKFDGNIMPAESAINFYTQFSNPVKSVYTWNRSLPSSQRSFIASDLAMYFGFASELPVLREKNPNLNFDVSYFPQAGEGLNTNFGKMYALSIAKNSNNANSAFSVIKTMTQDKYLELLSEINGLPPVSRNLLNKDPNDPYKEIFYRAALSSKAWLDPNPQETDAIFQNMIEAIISGREKTSKAISDANSEIKVLLE